MNRLHYKFTKLYYSTRIVNNSIKIKTDHSDITTYNCRIHFDAYVYSKYFIKFFILYDRSLTFKNMHSFFRDFSRQEHKIKELFKTWNSQVLSYTPFHFSFTVPLKSVNFVYIFWIASTQHMEMHQKNL